MASASVGEGLPRLPEATALRRASACNDAVFQQREKHHDSKKPTHRAFVVKKFTDKAGTDPLARYRQRLVAPRRQSLEALPTDGRIVIRLDEPKPAPAA
jgi:hypothetical protein